jgi:hypothetical protein
MPISARETHRRADVLIGVHRGHREIASLDAGTVALVAALVFTGGIPGAFHRVDRIEAAVHIVAVAHAVEDEEFVLGAEERVIGDAGGPEIGLCALGKRARVTLVALHGRRLDHVAANIDRGLFEERIDDRGRRLGHEDHVRLVDTLPSGDRGAIEHLAVGEEFLVHQPRGDRHVLLLAAGVGEAQVRELHLLLFDEFQYVTGCHIASGKGVASPRTFWATAQCCASAGPVPALASSEIKRLGWRLAKYRTTLVRSPEIIAPIGCALP